MKKLFMVNKLLALFSFIGALISLIYKSDVILVVSTILMAICVIITFIISGK